MEGAHVSVSADVAGVLSVEAGGKKAGRGLKSRRSSIEQNVLDLLVCRGVVSQAVLDRAASEAAESGDDMESLLLDRYQVRKDVLGAAMSDYYQCPYLPYDERTVIASDLLRPLNSDYLKNTSGCLLLAVANCSTCWPTTLTTLNEGGTSGAVFQA